MFMTRFFLTACLLLPLTAMLRAEAVEQIAFDAIQGAKRLNRTNRTWELAIGKSPTLFPDSDFLIHEFEDMKIGRNETRLLQLRFPARR